METLYILEFNENQQTFHLNDGSVDQGTHGWFTIADCVSELEYEVYCIYVGAHIRGRIFKKDKLLSDYLRLKLFWQNLIENNIEIRRGEI